MRRTPDEAISAGAYNALHDNYVRACRKADKYLNEACVLTEERDVAVERADRYEAVLRHIAEQGTGRFDPLLKTTVGEQGLPWKHWAEIAQEALDALAAPAQEEDQP